MIADPHPYEKCVDTPPDITNPKTFAISAILCIIFGAMIGTGFYISFAAFHISTDKAMAIIIMLFVAGAVPAVFLHWYRNRELFGEIHGESE